MPAILTSSDRAAAQRAIEHHYDISNEFYKLWLDTSMTYSCAMWVDGQYDANLEEAQLRKIDYHLSASHALKSTRVLDVGCGWGSLLQRLHEKNSMLKYATGLTLSTQQIAHIKSLNLPNIDIRQENWLDHHPPKPYDAIISIGAFEHFSTPEDSVEEKRAKYRKFFEFARSNLVSGGRLSLQTIAYLNMERSQANKFMEKDIFPNSDLPDLTDIIAAAAGTLEILQIRNDRLDYAHTCELWAHRLKAKRQQAVKLVGIDTVKRYERYLQMSSLGFFMKKICLFRIILQHNQ